MTMWQMLNRDFLCDINERKTLLNCYKEQGGGKKSFHDAQFMRHFTCKHSETFEYVNNNNFSLFVAAVFVFPLNCFLFCAVKKKKEKLLKEAIQNANTNGIYAWLFGTQYKTESNKFI